jgi:glycopeptide antibiotics resistance protein
MMRLISGLFLGTWLIGTLAFTLRAAHPLPGQVVTDNLIPFATIRIYLANLETPFWQSQAVGNVLLLLPVGLFGPLALPWLGRWWRVLLAAAFLSVGIELAQLAIPDRSADVDDVMLNVIGAMVGYVLLHLIGLRPRSQRPVPLRD